MRKRLKGVRVKGASVPESLLGSFFEEMLITKSVRFARKEKTKIVFDFREEESEHEHEFVMVEKDAPRPSWCKVCGAYRLKNGALVLPEEAM